ATLRPTIAATSAAIETLAPMAIACPPAALISATVVAAPSSVRSETATRAPSRAIASAAARPIPEAPPLTSALLPAQIPVIASCLFPADHCISGSALCLTEYPAALVRLTRARLAFFIPAPSTRPSTSAAQCWLGAGPCKGRFFISREHDDRRLIVRPARVR